MVIRSTAPNPDFKIGVKAPLSINPEHTPGFSPGSEWVDFRIILKEPL